MNNYLLTLMYDGSAYHGWQVQDNAVTVQGTLQDAVERIIGVRESVTGCSRTDSGVH
ncbi:MAG TPA: tRNA pseudouridine(38-40) synthase TruA, partial [Ruminococcaceae bacterium]|nr:tRNA pseudouridine(38-40) synthase TruA [Oscillospiraceae bacterium]